MMSIETLADLLQAILDVDQKTDEAKVRRNQLMRAVALKLEPIPGGVRWNGFAFSVDDGHYKVTFPAGYDLPDASEFRIVYPIPGEPEEQ